MVGSELFVLSRDYQHGVSVVGERVEDISTFQWSEALDLTWEKWS